MATSKEPTTSGRYLYHVYTEYAEIDSNLSCDASFPNLHYGTFRTFAEAKDCQRAVVQHAESTRDRDNVDVFWQTDEDTYPMALFSCRDMEYSKTYRIAKILHEDADDVPLGGFVATRPSPASAYEILITEEDAKAKTKVVRKYPGSWKNESDGQAALADVVGEMERGVGKGWKRFEWTHYGPQGFTKATGCDPVSGKKFVCRLWWTKKPSM